MDFVMGKAYKFSGDLGTLVLEFLREEEDYYITKVIGGTMIADEHGEHKNVWKSSRILRTWKCEEYEIPVQKSSGINYRNITPKKRRTKDEIAMDDFLENCLTKRKIEVLKVEIDEALISEDKEEFIKLTKELQKLQKKVTA